MKLRIGIGLIAVLAVAFAALWWPRNEVTIEAVDPALRIREAKIWHWRPVKATYMLFEHPTLVHFRDLTAKPLKRFWLNYGTPPGVTWMEDPKCLPLDELLLFGTYRQRIWSMDMLTTNGDTVGSSGGSDAFATLPHHRGIIWTNFGLAIRMETNLHGVFWLRERGDTNALAKVTIR